MGIIICSCSGLIIKHIHITGITVEDITDITAQENEMPICFSTPGWLNPHWHEEPAALR